MPEKFYLRSAGFIGTADFRWLPLAHGTQVEATQILDSWIDNINFVVPYDLQVNKIFFNTARSQSSDKHPMNTHIALWKFGVKFSDDVVVKLDDTGYDSYDLNKVYVFDFKNKNSIYEQGSIMQLSLRAENPVDYYSLTLIGEYLEDNEIELEQGEE